MGNGWNILAAHGKTGLTRCRWPASRELPLKGMASGGFVKLEPPDRGKRTDEAPIKSASTRDSGFIKPPKGNLP